MTSSVQWNFTGQRVLVTGAASGLGLAIATAFASAGAHVVILGRDRTALDVAAQKLRQTTIIVPTVVVCDLASRPSIIRAAQEVIQLLGGIDILVNNAGVGGSSAFTDLTDADLDLQIDVNLVATIVMTRELIPGRYVTPSAAVDALTRRRTLGTGDEVEDETLDVRAGSRNGSHPVILPGGW